MKKHIIIIGNGAAGNAALEEIIPHMDPFTVTVITHEPSPIYYRPMLSEYISEPDVPKRFYLHDDAWYRSNGIQILYNRTVREIDSNLKKVVCDDGASYTYDQLILCTGSKNFIPPIPGACLKNVTDLRTLNDANTLKKLVRTTQSAVIIGGGLLGLELGWQLKKLNLDVTVVEMMPRLLPRQLDEEASHMFEEKVLATGIKIIKGVQTQEIVGTDHVEGVLLSTGKVLDAELVIFSVGIRADVELAKHASLAVDRGIIVDSKMKTSDASIYAAGDCAQFENQNYAIWPEAVAQGRVAGRNAIGIPAEYISVIPFNIYHGMGLRLFSIGDVGCNPNEDYEIVADKMGEDFEKIFLLNDRIVGGILLGNISKSNLLKKAVQEGFTKSQYLQP